MPTVERINERTTVRALFLGSGYAGHRTRFANLRSHLEADPRLHAEWDLVTGWRPGHLLERLTPLPRSVRGRLRATFEASRIARFPRPDVVWTAAGPDLAPFAWTQQGRIRRPMVLDLDWTVDLREAMAPDYLGRPAREGMARRWARAREAAVWRGVTVFTPWSHWAADALRARGVAEERIRVIPPGVDLDWWSPASWQPPGETPGETPRETPLRLLFVGGDFRRKGGDLLLEAVRGPLSGRCELDIVTREEVPAGAGVRVHRAEPNSSGLRDLYHRSDLFVMPSRAECYGLATIEAMASGLPAMVSNVGASSEIVQDGATGWLVAPDVTSVATRLDAIVRDRAPLRGMGEAARQRAEAHFDGPRNDRLVADLLVGLARMWTSSRP